MITPAAPSVTSPETNIKSSLAGRENNHRPSIKRVHYSDPEIVVVVTDKAARSISISSKLPQQGHQRACIPTHSRKAPRKKRFDPSISSSSSDNESSGHISTSTSTSSSFSFSTTDQPEPNQLKSKKSDSSQLTSVDMEYIYESISDVEKSIHEKESILHDKIKVYKELSPAATKNRDFASKLSLQVNDQNQILSGKKAFVTKESSEVRSDILLANKFIQTLRKNQLGEIRMLLKPSNNVSNHELYFFYV